MKDNPLIELQKLGQSIWYDNIRRGLLTSGELKRMIDAGEIVGVTSNPAIFEKAIAGSTDYDEAMTTVLRENPHADAEGLYEKLIILYMKEPMAWTGMSVWRSHLGLPMIPRVPSPRPGGSLPLSTAPM
jgi:hypothetical protein